MFRLWLEGGVAPMLQLDLLARAQPHDAPFRHLTARGLLDDAMRAPLRADFPDPKRPGFYPVEELACGSSVLALVDELRSEPFSRVVGAKLGLQLVGLPQMVVLRRWSAARDGRPHTDGEDKIATALLYCNDGWTGSAGSLRYLEGPSLDGPGGAPIPADFGAFTTFARSERSWHGHLPFTGERRVIQVFWLRGAEALERKRRRHRRANWLKALWPHPHAQREA